jgi:hypothetical protein
MKNPERRSGKWTKLSAIIGIIPPMLASLLAVVMGIVQLGSGYFGPEEYMPVMLVAVGAIGLAYPLERFGFLERILDTVIGLKERMDTSRNHKNNQKD